MSNSPHLTVRTWPPIAFVVATGLVMYTPARAVCATARAATKDRMVLLNMASKGVRGRTCKVVGRRDVGGVLFA